MDLWTKRCVNLLDQDMGAVVVYLCIVDLTIKQITTIMPLLQSEGCLGSSASYSGTYPVRTGWRQPAGLWWRGR